MCVDYTNLNKACPKDIYSLPCIDKLVDFVVGHKVLTFLDSYNGYNQNPMHLNNVEKTVFIMEQGTYCYKVMPFNVKWCEYSSNK